MYQGKNEKIIFELSYSQGLPVKDVQKIAKQQQVSLIVAPFKSNVGLMTSFYQGAAMSINNKVKCPVLLVPSNAQYQQIQTIVYATKLSGENESSSIDTLLNLAAHFDAKVQCLHICTQTNTKNKATIKVEELKNSFSQKNNLSFHIEDFEDVVQGLELFIAKESPDILVMHFHKQNIFQKMIATNKVYGVLNKNTVPVLLLKK